jgi:hypothetical protein
MTLQARLSDGFCVQALLLLALTACGTLIGNPEEDEDTKKKDPITSPLGSETPTPMDQGTVRFALADAPVDDAEHVFIYVKAMGLKSDAAADFTDLTLDTVKELDLLQYRSGLSYDFGDINIEPGDYSEIRLVLDSENHAKIVLKDGSEEALKVPSGTSSGLKIKSNFSVAKGETTKMVVEFDLYRSLKVTGGGSGNGNGQGNGDKPAKYMLKPVLKAVKEAKVGKVVLTPAGEETVACAYLAEAKPKTPNAECDGAEGTGVLIDGTIVIPFLRAGSYAIVTFNKDGKAAGELAAAVEAGKSTELPN